MKIKRNQPIKTNRFIWAFFIFLSLSLLSIPNITHGQSTQESRIETFTIPIPQLDDRPKNIQVYLPPDYDTSENAYPVIYLHNGDDLFNPRPDAVGDYKVDETLDDFSLKGP